MISEQVTAGREDAACLGLWLGAEIRGPSGVTRGGLVPRPGSKPPLYPSLSGVPLLHLEVEEKGLHCHFRGGEL